MTIHIHGCSISATAPWGLTHKKTVWCSDSHAIRERNGTSVSLIKGLVCQICLRAAPKRGKRLICSVVLLWCHVCFEHQHSTISRTWGCFFLYMFLNVSSLWYFWLQKVTRLSCASSLLLQCRVITIICGFGWEYNYVSRIHIDPQNLLIIVLAHKACLCVSSKLLPTSRHLTSHAILHISPLPGAVF